MRRIFLILGTLLALTPLAHADGFDNLTITGNGQILTFTFPNTSSTVEYYREDRIGFGGGNSGTINGVAGQPVGADFYLGVERMYGSFHLNIGNEGYDFYGDYPISATQVPDPDYPFPDYDLVTANLLPGTYDLFTIDFTDFARTPYTLTVTPEVPTSPTPEPATLALLATGAVGLLTRVRRRVTTA